MNYFNDMGAEPEQGNPNSMFRSGGNLPMPPAFEPYTQADELRLQRLQQGLSGVQEKIDGGEFDPRTGARMKARIQQLQKPLLARQAQATAQAEQDQFKMFQKQTAMAEALQQQNAEYRTKGFNNRVASFTDPLSGQTAFLYESSPNNWAQIELSQGGEGDTEQPQMGAGVQGGTPAYLEGAGKDEKRPFVQTIQNGPNTTATVFPGLDEQGKPMKPDNGPPPQDASEAQMTVWLAKRNQSGVPLEVWEQAEKDAQAPPGQRQQEQAILNQGELAFYEREAQKGVPKPTNPRDPRQQAAYRKAIVDNFQNLTTAAIRRKQHAIDAKARVAQTEQRQAGQVAAQQQALQQREQAKQQADQQKVKQKEEADFEKTKPKPFDSAKAWSQAEAEAKASVDDPTAKEELHKKAKGAYQQQQEAHKKEMEAWESQARLRKADPRALKALGSLKQQIGTTEKGAPDLGSASTENLLGLYQMLGDPAKVGMTPKTAQNLQATIKAVVAARYVARPKEEGQQEPVQEQPVTRPVPNWFHDSHKSVGDVLRKVRQGQ